MKSQTTPLHVHNPNIHSSYNKALYGSDTWKVDTPASHQVLVHTSQPLKFKVTAEAYTSVLEQQHMGFWRA